jgi:hypothetical protein
MVLAGTATPSFVYSDRHEAQLHNTGHFKGVGLVGYLAALLDRAMHVSLSLGTVCAEPNEMCMHEPSWPFLTGPLIVSLFDRSQLHNIH